MFKEVGGEDDHIASSRAFCQSVALKAIRHSVQEIAQCFDGRWKPDVFSFLRSLGGGGMQEPHSDFTTEDLARAAARHCGAVPSSVIVALELGTFLRVFSGCFDIVDAKKARIVEIPPGYCIIFRGDLVHSGVGYAADNHRLHCYLSVGDEEREPDIVSSASTMFKCNFCDYTRPSNTVQQHQLVCQDNPGGAANREKKRLRDQGPVYCYMCDGQGFGTRSGLRKHIRIVHTEVKKG